MNFYEAILTPAACGCRSGQRRDDEARERLRVNVAARDDDADALDARGEFAEERGRGGDRARRLDEHLEAEKYQAHRLDYLVFGDGEHVLRVLLKYRKGERAGGLRAHAVGDGRGRRDANALALQQRLPRVVRQLRLDGEAANV